MRDHRPSQNDGASATDLTDAARNGDAPAEVRCLSDATVDRIAAGEVITRPVRVVEELLDNALDADATRIRISVRGDGTDEIRVADDGRGMCRRDAELAVERHATSKLRDGDSPIGVDSLGFRGEALPAIADAARLELATNDGGALGTRVVVDDASGAGGRDGRDGDRGVDRSDAGVTVTDAGRARGTTVVAKDLFRDRPARRDALSGPKTEFARISATVADYALARPDVAFTLEHDGRETLSTPGTGPTDALLGVYDRDVAGRSTEVDAGVRADLRGVAPDESTGAALRVRGTLAYPSITRAARDHLRVAVNGRPVANAALKRAVRAGYGTLLPDGREPVAAVDVSLPSEAVDPNVHPAKREVGLRDADAVADAVETVVADALAGADLRRKTEVATDIETALSAVEGPDPFADVEPVGQYRDLYLLCDAGDELLVVDGHAAHERVNYERLKQAFADGAVATAALDPPATVSLSGPERAAAEAHDEELRRLGFDVEPFGGGTVRLHAVPAPFGRAVDADAFRDALDAFAAGESPADPREALLTELACHPSIERGDALDDEAARQLLDRLGECEQPFACPHGRPTVLSIDERTLVSGFERHDRL